MSREIVVKVLLNAEEFLSFQHVCDQSGLAQSARIRWLIKKDIEEFAHDQNLGQEQLFDNGLKRAK